MRISYLQLCSVALALATVLFAPSALAQPVIYVDADASGADDGSSWANAFEELDDALAAAGSSAQIWVAQGVYRPTDDTDRDESFELRSGVILLGGFVGTETSVDQRNTDPDENGTVLSGDIGVRGDASDNSYHVVTAEGVDETAVLDGFTIRDGNADAASPHDRGGGLSNYDGTTTREDGEGYPTLRGLVFSDNWATYGGGVYLNGAAGVVTFEDVEFVGNEATLQGGGMYVNTDVEMESVEFEENRAFTHGGGAWFSGGESILRDVEFDSNELTATNADQFGGGAHVRAGTKLTLVDVVFERNRVSRFEIGHGGAFSIQSNAVVDIINAEFIGNTGRDAPGILIQADAVLRVVNAVFAGHGNTATGFSVIDGYGNADVTLTNVSMSGNQADYAVDIKGSVPLSAANLIIWGNTGSPFNPARTDIELENAIIEGGYSGGESILADDPLFVRAPDIGPDGEWGTDDDDYGDLRLREGSPALNFGDTDDIPQDDFDLDGDGVTGELLPFDLDGEARVQDGEVDLGPYEGVTAVVSAESGARAGGGMALSVPAPNPTRGIARMTLNVETAEHVDIGVYDLLGRQLVELYNGPLAVGELTFEIDGAAFPAGVYVVRASSAQGMATRRMTVVR